VTRHVAASVFLLAAALPISAQTPEPEYSNVFMAIQAGKLVPLERQTATITGHVRAGGFGGAKVASEFKPAQSPVRFAAGQDVVFVVRRGPGQDTLDPDTLYVLRSLKAKGKSRELMISNMRGPFLTGGTSSNLAEGVLPVSFEKYGEHSLTIRPTAPLQPGEYALSPRYSMTDLFCFGVDGR
jgi:hypothetical protein